MCVVYWSEIHRLIKSQRGLIFNGFRPKSQQWKYATLTNIFVGLVFAHFLSILHEEHIIQQLKAWSFRIWKKSRSYTQSNSNTITRWSSVTFFWYTLTLYSRNFETAFYSCANFRAIVFEILAVQIWTTWGSSESYTIWFKQCKHNPVRTTKPWWL
jgi:hypothetical protein